MYTTFGIIGLASLASFVLYAALRLSLGVIRIALRIIARLRKPAPAPAPVPTRDGPAMTREAAQEVLAKMQMDYMEQKQKDVARATEALRAASEESRRASQLKRDQMEVLRLTARARTRHACWPLEQFPDPRVEANPPRPDWAADLLAPCFQVLGDEDTIRTLVEAHLEYTPASHRVVLYCRGEWYKLTKSQSGPWPYLFEHTVQGVSQPPGRYREVETILEELSELVWADRSEVPVGPAAGPWINTCDDPRRDSAVVPGPAWAQGDEVPCIELVNRPDHALVGDAVEDLMNRSEAGDALVIYEQGEWYKIETDGERRPGFPEGTYWFRYTVDGRNHCTGPHSRIDGVLRGLEIARHQRWVAAALKAAR